MFGALFHSYVLSQIFGLYMIIMAIVLMSRIKFYRDLIQNLDSEHNAGIIFGASFGLMLGLFLVVIHNIWVWEPRVIVTILAWFILIKSILWLSLPEAMLKGCKKLYAGPGYYFVVLILLVFGLILMTKGFYLYL